MKRLWPQRKTKTAKNYTKVLDNWKEKLTTIDLLGGDYRAPPSALISIQNDNATTYDTYLQVQNELQSAVNELRDELAIAKFGRTYKELEDLYDRNSGQVVVGSNVAVRSVYPQRILRLNRVKDQPTTDMGSSRKAINAVWRPFQRLLPDIVFMLLFFFMVATVLRTEEEKVRMIRPEASELYKIEKKPDSLRQHRCSHGPPVRY